MITVIGMWEPGYTDEQSYFENTVWNQTISCFAVDRYIMVCGEETGLKAVSKPEQYDTMDEALSTTKGKRIFLTFPIKGAKDMKTFKHPKNAVYIFGKPSDNLLKYVRKQDIKLHIFTPNNVDMLACSCVAAVLYDRMVK